MGASNKGYHTGTQPQNQKYNVGDRVHYIVDGKIYTDAIIKITGIKFKCYYMKGGLQASHVYHWRNDAVKAL